MRQSRLVDYLLGFSKPELKALKKIADSPYLCNENAVRKLLHELIQTHSKWSVLPISSTNDSEADSKRIDRYLSRTRMKKLLFGDPSAEDGRLRRVVSVALSVVTEFMQIESLRKEEQKLLQERLKLQYLADQSRTDLFRSEYDRKKIVDSFGQMHSMDVNDLAELARIKSISNQFETRYYGKGMGEGYAEEVAILDHQFVLKKLQTFCALVNSSRIFQPVDFPHKELVLAMAISEPLFQIPLVEIFYHLLALLEGRGGIEGDQRIQGLLRDHDGEFSLFALKQIYSFRINIFEFWQKEGKGDFRVEIFRIVKWMAREKIVVVNGKIADSYFFKFCKEGFRNEQKEWLGQFSKDFSEHVSGPNREVVLEYANCCIDYLQKRYNSLLDRAFSIESGETLFQLEIAVLRMKSLFLVDEFTTEEGRTIEMTLFYSQARQMINRRPDLHPDLAQDYQSFFRLANALGAVRHGNKPLRDRLRNEISTTTIPEADWLRKQLGNLK